ncbi:glycosyltransferase [Cohnella caldifontis]|uniref:glycosyltransferase n=1 Tax=Cohnella caldifontis TaxID=3027471 RepID=UPI0023EAC5F1|nr:glycosyltransferase [Cohnella sp. YIM B05605]
MGSVANIPFSVSMCVYKKDHPEHFKQALESVMNQTRKPDEIILVVDGPISNSLDDVIKRFETESSLKVIRLPHNVGHGNARRIGLDNCTYELVALMDADDICLPDRFEKQIRCFEQHDQISIVGGQILEFIDNESNIVGMREVPLHDDEIKRYLKKRCPFNQMTVMFKLSEVQRAGGYRDWYQNEDYYLWIRMYQGGAEFMNLEDPLVLVRVGREMYDRRGGWKYFQSEALLQKLMLNQGIIGIRTFAVNLGVRFILQVLLPNKLRGYVFKRFARKKVFHHNSGSVLHG